MSQALPAKPGDRAVCRRYSAAAGSPGNDTRGTIRERGSPVSGFRLHGIWPVRPVRGGGSADCHVEFYHQSERAKASGRLWLLNSRNRETRSRTAPGWARIVLGIEYV